MPRVHECGITNCHKVIPMGQRYCRQHWEVMRQRHPVPDTPLSRSLAAATKALRSAANQKYNATGRDQEANAFYHSKQWRPVRDHVYSRDMATCQACGEVVKDRKLVDHIIPRRLCTWTQALDPSNLWTLCYRCHTIKTELEQHIAAQPNGDTKLMHLSCEWWAKVIRERIHTK